MINPEESLAAARRHGRTKAGPERQVVRFGKQIVSTTYRREAAEGVVGAVVGFFKSLFFDKEKRAYRELSPAEQTPILEQEHAKKGYNGSNRASVVDFLNKPTSMRNGRPILEQFVQTSDGHLYFIEPPSVSDGKSTMLFVPNGDFSQARSVVFFDTKTKASILDESKLKLAAMRYCKLYNYVESAKKVEAKKILLRLIKKNGGVQDLANWHQHPQVRAIILEAYKDTYEVNGERIYNEETSTPYTDDEIVDDVLGENPSLDTLDDLILSETQRDEISRALYFELSKYYTPEGVANINPNTGEPWTDSEILADLPDFAVEVAVKQMGTLTLDIAKDKVRIRAFTHNVPVEYLGDSQKGTDLKIPKEVLDYLKKMKPGSDNYYIPPPRTDDDTGSDVSDETFLTAREAPSLLGGHSVTSVSTSTTSDSGDLIVRTPAEIRQASELRDLQSEASRSESGVSIAASSVALGETTVEATEARIAALEERVAQLEAAEEMTVTEREADINTLRNELEEAQRSLEEQNTAHQGLRRQLLESEDRASGLQAALHAAGERNEDLERELKTAQQRVAELEGRLGESREARRELRRMVGQVTTRLNIVQEELGKLRQAQARGTEAVAAVRQTLIETYKANLETLRANAEQQNETLEELRGDLASKQAELETLKRQLQVAEAPHPPTITPSALAMLRNQMETSHEATEKANAEIEALKQANQQLKQELEARTTQEQLLAEREETIGSLTQQIQELEAQSEAQARELEPLRTKLEEIEEEYLGAQTQLQAVHVAHGITQGTIAAQREALQTMQAELKEAREAYGRSEKEKGELTGELTRVQSTLNRNKAELERLRVTQETELAPLLESFEQENAQQIKELEEQQKLIAGLKKELDAQAQLATLPPPSSELPELRAQLEETQQALNAAKERLAEMQTALAAEAEMRTHIVGAAQEIQREQREAIEARDAEADALHRTIALAQQINAEQRAQHARLMEELTAEFARRQFGRDQRSML